MSHTVAGFRVKGQRLHFTDGLRMRRAWLWLAAALVWGALTPGAAAQNIQHSKNTQDLALRHNFTVDPVSLSLNIQFTLGEYNGRGGALLPVALRYSSKLWRLDYAGYRSPEFGGGLTDDITFTMLSAVYGDPDHDTMTPGWSNSLELPTLVDQPEWFRSTGMPCDLFTNCADAPSTDPHGGGSTELDAWVVRRIRLRMPDGSTHELRADDTVRYYNVQTLYPLTYYATDGSRLRYTQLGSGTTPGGAIVYMPDGSCYMLGVNGFTGFVDRNGNKLRVDRNANTFGLVWSDALGREISFDGMPGVNNTTRHYTFVYRRLKDPQTGESALTDPQQPLSYYGPGQWSAVPMVPTVPALFDSGTGADRIGSFGSHSDASGKFNPSVIYQIVAPDGSAYTFTYNTYGEIDKIVYPTGGYEKFEYAPIPGLTLMNLPYTLTNRGVVRRVLSPDGNPANEQEWLYGAEELSPSVLRVTTIAPDSTVSDRYVHRGVNPGVKYFGFDDSRSGMTFEERVYAPGPNRGDRGAMLRRKLTEWGMSQYTVPFPPDVASGHRTVSRDAKVLKEVQILLDTHGGNDLASTTLYAYAQASQPLNVTSVKQYGYVSLAPGAGQSAAFSSFPGLPNPIRTTVTSYLDEPAYNNRNLVALPLTVTTWKGAAEVIVARNEVRYDEAVFPVVNYPDIGNWIDPATTAQGSIVNAQGNRAIGNATTSRSWLDTTNTWIETHAQYDQAGNVVKAYDAHEETTAAVHGQLTETVYTSTYRYAYPEQLKSPVPDPTPNPLVGPQGSTAPLVSLTSYDLNTGLVTSTTDPNNQTTTYSYADGGGTPDPLNRLRKVTGPDGGWTSYDYGNAPNNFFVRVRSAIDSSRATDFYQYFDGLGRLSRSYSNDGTTPGRAWVARKITYDEMGRAAATSNPQFTADLGDFTPTGGVTTNAYDALGRVRTVTGPDGAVKTMFYSGNETTVTNPAGNTTRSVSDALGRLTDVYEANDSNLRTTYVYDALDNLRTVQQGVQQRAFAYDSLKRLSSATNPEFNNLATSYVYDARGNVITRTDARGVVTTYTYDKIGRARSRSYSDNTPTVTFFYDGAGVAGGVVNAGGRLTSVSSSVSTYSYTAFDALGRVRGTSQTIDGVSYTMPDYQYNLAGGLISEQYPSGRVVKTEYDEAARTAGVKSQGAAGYYVGASAADAVNRIQYAAHGAVSSMRLGNGLWEHTSFNGRHQPTQIGLGTSATNAGVLQLDYTYGLIVGNALDTTKNNGNVQSQHIKLPGLDVTQSYEYDQLDRIRMAREVNNAVPCRDQNNAPTDCWRQVYRYDRYGNRNFDAGTTFPSLPANLTDLANNPFIDPATNRIVEDQNGDSVKDYQYDQAGNVTRNAPGLTFAYDAENKQKTLNGGANAGGASYLYDGDGRRVKKVTQASTTVFVYDAAGLLVAEYSSEAPPPTAGGTKYLTNDNLGSPRVITDQTRNVVSRHDYAPFGEELTAGRTADYRQDSVRQQFTGQERDRESGLDFFQARYYSAPAGRFMSIDPLAASGKSVNPQTWNRYTYVLNNPLKLIDPSGMEPGDTDECKRLQPKPVKVTIPKQVESTMITRHEGEIERDTSIITINLSGGPVVDDIATQMVGIYANAELDVQSYKQADDVVGGTDSGTVEGSVPPTLTSSVTTNTARSKIVDAFAGAAKDIAPLAEKLKTIDRPDGNGKYTDSDVESIKKQTYAIGAKQAKDALGQQQMKPPDGFSKTDPKLPYSPYMLQNCIAGLCAP